MSVKIYSSKERDLNTSFVHAFEYCAMYNSVSLFGVPSEESVKFGHFGTLETRGKENMVFSSGYHAVGYIVEDELGGQLVICQIQAC
jgi:hypothetical protein